MPHALATVQDLEGTLGRDLTSAEAARAETLLGQASAKVKSYTRQAFLFVADDEQVLRPVGTELRLPQRPVTEVSKVVAIGGGNGLPDVLLSGWTWDGLDIVDVVGCMDPNIWVSLPEWFNDYSCRPNTFRVTYSHGYAQVPPEVVAVVVQMTLRTLTSPSPSEGLVSERVGQYNYQMQQGSGSVGAGVKLNDADKQELAEAGYKRRAGTIQLRT